MFRTLLFGLFLLVFAAKASAQTPPPAPTTVRHTTRQQTTHRTTGKPRRTTVRKTSTKKVGMAAPATRPAAVVRSQPVAAAASDPASGKGQGVYAAPGEPVNVQSTPTTGYDGPAPKRAKSASTLKQH